MWRESQGLKGPHKSLKWRAPDWRRWEPKMNEGQVNSYDHVLLLTVRRITCRLQDVLVPSSSFYVVCTDFWHINLSPGQNDVRIRKYEAIIT